MNEDLFRQLRAHVLMLLRSIHPFPARKDTRKKLRQPGQVTPYYQFALGRVVKLDEGITSSQFNKRFPELLAVCRALVRAYDPNFKYDAIQVNKNQQCAAHKDTNNEGPSLIIGLGKYTGGQLLVEKTQKFNIRNKFVSFDGRLLHETPPFEGERYSLVFFRIKSSHKKASAAKRSA